MNKQSLSERDICTKFITPGLTQGGCDEMLQIREEVSFTKGRIVVRGKLVTRGPSKRAVYIPYYKPNIPIALIEAKDNSHSVGDGMQQALDYATTSVVVNGKVREEASSDSPKAGVRRNLLVISCVEDLEQIRFRRAHMRSS
jgi:type I site-specific restriction endonuclease